MTAHATHTATSLEASRKGSPSLYVEVDHDLPLVSIAVSSKTGAALDPPGKEGLTRVMARMLRRGCGDLSAQQVEERLDALGAEFNVDVMPSVITLHLDVISRHVEGAIDLLTQMVTRPRFDPTELDRLLRESAGELVDFRDNDAGLATRHFREALFAGHPYARRTCGRAETLARLTSADVAAQFHLCFSKSNLALSFAGDLASERAVELAARLAAGLQAGRPAAEELPDPRPARANTLVFVDKPERTQTQILVGCIGSHPREPEFLPLTVATTVLGGTFSSRLMREIRSRRGWSYGAYARLPHERTRDAFSVWTFPGAQDASRCLSLTLKLLERWRVDGITEKELAFAKRFLIRSHAFEIDTPNKRVHQRLDEELFDLPEGYHRDYLDRVEAVTAQAATNAIHALIRDQNLVTAVLGTYADIGPQIAEAIPGLEKVDIVRFDED